MADYEYDIFISYRRMDDGWIRWAKENFVRPLRSLLCPALGNVKIFIDEQIETGVSWPEDLARAHARSKLMIPILSRDFFNSVWCRLELALMCHREEITGWRTRARPDVLILPMVIDDGNCFPPQVQKMQAEKIHDFANPCMCRDGPSQEAFAARLKNWCPRIEQALKTVPNFDPNWETLNHDQFTAMFQIEVAKLKTLPPLSLLPLPSVGGAP